MRSRVFCMRIAVLAICMLFLAELKGVTVHAAFDNSVKEGTVAVVFYLKDALLGVTTDGKQVKWTENLGDTQYSNGSGFFIGASDENPQYIVTNCHVVENFIEAGEGGQFLDVPGWEYQNGYAVIGAKSCELRIYYSENDYDIAYVDSYGEVDKVDLAVLRLRNATDKRNALQLMLPTEDMVGEFVYTVGYPGNADNEFTGASKYGVDDATVHKGSINKFVMSEGTGVERIAIDATIQHGNSGGPLVTESGYVIGVNTNVYSTSPYANQIEADYYAISASELVRFLDKNNVPYEMANVSSSGSAVLGGGENIGSDKDVDRNSSKDSGNGGMGLIIAVILVVALLAVGTVVVALILILSRKKSGQSRPQPQSAANSVNAVSSGPKAVIRSMAAQHGGKAFPVGKAPITIGRNPAGCTIVFKEGTPGVSGTHCTISYDAENGLFILTDLNSSYGTFLAGGTRLTANIPIKLKPGDLFYIGDKANVFKLEVG